MLDALNGSGSGRRRGTPSPSPNNGIGSGGLSLPRLTPIAASPQRGVAVSPGTSGSGLSLSLGRRRSPSPFGRSVSPLNPAEAAAPSPSPSGSAPVTFLEAIAGDTRPRFGFVLFRRRPVSGSGGGGGGTAWGPHVMVLTRNAELRLFPVPSGGTAATSSTTSTLTTAAAVQVVLQSRCVASQTVTDGTAVRVAVDDGLSVLVVGRGSGAWTIAQWEGAEGSPVSRAVAGFVVASAPSRSGGGDELEVRGEVVEAWVEVLRPLTGLGRGRAREHEKQAWDERKRSEQEKILVGDGDGKGLGFLANQAEVTVKAAAAAKEAAEAAKKEVGEAARTGNGEGRKGRSKDGRGGLGIGRMRSFENVISAVGLRRSPEPSGGGGGGLEQVGAAKAGLTLGVPGGNPGLDPPWNRPRAASSSRGGGATDPPRKRDASANPTLEPPQLQPRSSSSPRGGGDAAATPSLDRYQTPSSKGGGNTDSRAPAHATASRALAARILPRVDPLGAAIIVVIVAVAPDSAARFPIAAFQQQFPQATTAAEPAPILAAAAFAATVPRTQPRPAVGIARGALRVVLVAEATTAAGKQPSPRPQLQPARILAR
ncbi:hypothetical protein DFJ73DRAFT_943308 [Zopfochytrium polystomum]|nr:hypothetical protein DFJ73DRAFT_943308 [Zopfochytrium polystomum]